MVGRLSVSGACVCGVRLDGEADRHQDSARGLSPGRVSPACRALEPEGVAQYVHELSGGPPSRCSPRLSGKALDVDMIFRRADGLVFAPLVAVRFPTAKDAKRRLANDQPLLQRALSPQDRSVLPPGVNLARLRDVRVCNVVVTSYNATG